MSDHKDNKQQAHLSDALKNIYRAVDNVRTAQRFTEGATGQRIPREMMDRVLGPLRDWKEQLQALEAATQSVEYAAEPAAETQVEDESGPYVGPV